MLFNAKLGIAAGLVATAAIAGASAFAYQHGKTVAQGKAVNKIERLVDNYVALLVIEKQEKFAEIGYERQRAREALQTAELALESGDQARAANRAALAAERERAANAERQAAEALNNLERMRHEWSDQRVPNELVCGVYDGVLDIPGCADIRAAAASDDADNSLEFFGSEPAGEWSDPGDGG